MDLIVDQLWRIQNLYKIVNKEGKSCTFKLNPSQEKIFRELHTCNIVLKARQLGISTFCCLYLLDECLFNKNFTAGIIAHTREDAEYLFKRVKYAYDNLPAIHTSEGIIDLKDTFKARSDSARELSFVNGSMIRVGTSMRSATLNILHISEFGKICAQFPSKAQEIITGSLNTVATGQRIIIESTAEGSSGPFKNMCVMAEERSKDNKKLLPTEYKFFFFPWHKHDEYQLNENVYIPPNLEEYFSSLKAKGINLHAYQKIWYAQKYIIQKEAMLREYPSLPSEAFQASTDTQYYARYINQAYDEKRIGNFPYDPAALVYTSWDLGFFDSMCVWYFQVTPSKDLRIIDFHETSGQSLADNIKIVKSKPYIYGDHFVPHDAKVHEMSTGLTRLEIAYELGINMTVLDRTSIQDGIDLVKSTLQRCFFHLPNTEIAINHLMNYCKEWNTALGKPEERPRHDEHSHACFVAGTKIRTLFKNINIEDLKIGDHVLTPTGARKITCLHSHQTNNLYKIITNKSEIICTPSHKFFTTNGMVSADALRNNDRIFEAQKIWDDSFYIKKLDLGFRDYFTLVMMMKSFFPYTENVDEMVDITKLVDNVKHACIYIDQFSNTSMEIYNMDITFITLMRTLETTISAICNLLKKVNIYLITEEKIKQLEQVEKILNLLLQKLQNGIKVKLVLDGIDDTQLSAISKNFAQLIANLNLDELTIKILKSVNLKSASEDMKLINTLHTVHVQKVVELNREDKIKVYDFTVENDHCYFANDLLVSNSDGFRYLCNAYKKYFTDTRKQVEEQRLMPPIFDTVNFPLGHQYY